MKSQKTWIGHSKQRGLMVNALFGQRFRVALTEPFYLAASAPDTDRGL